MRLAFYFVPSALFFGPLGLWLLGVKPPGYVASAPSPPLPPITRIQAMSDLATTRVQIADIIEGENENYEARWSLHGEAVLGVDLSKAKYAYIAEPDRKATLLLPYPHLVSSKVDHTRSTELFARSKTWIPVGGGLQSLRDEVWKHADRKIERIGQHDGYAESTKVQAERVLDGLFREIGWKIVFQWQPKGNPATGA